MKPISKLQILSPLLKKPFFTSKEARKMGVHPSVLSYYLKTGHLKRISRGVYQATDYQNPSAFRWTDLIEAVYSIEGGVICLISALAIYDLTEEIPREHWIAVRHGTSVKARRHLKIIRLRNIETGKTTIELEGVKISIFDKERTIIDSFRLLSLETAIKALKTAISQKGKNRLDLKKLQVYARKFRVDIAPYLMSITT